MTKRNAPETPDPLRIREPSAIPGLLYEHRSGPVCVRIWGPRKGWRWKRVEYFRYIRSTRRAGQWIKVFPDRESDQRYLLGCVKAATAWLKEQDAP